MRTEEIVVYGLIFVVTIAVLGIYILIQRRNSKTVGQQIELAKVEGTFEPVSLYPYIDTNTCIKSGACVKACPEETVIGIRNGRATLVNASKCVGHGACFHACPVEAISLRIGTEQRGVDIPHINQSFETNVSGIFIAGELGGMGLIKNSVEQGKQAVENIAKNIDKTMVATYDLVVVGAGPAGIAALLQAKKMGLHAIALEQDTIGGTVSTFPRAKVVMTAPMDLPLHGKMKLFETTKDELISIWQNVIQTHQINIKESSKVEKITMQVNGSFIVQAADESEYAARKVLIAIGRRGSPRKLGVKGEDLQKVAYRLLEPELIKDKNILVVGGGDSAIESALLLADDNKVILSYRSEKFNRLKPKNQTKIQKAAENRKLTIAFETNVVEIKEKSFLLKDKDGQITEVDNDLIYIFAGGELPTQFLQQSGIEILKRFGYTILSHKK